MDYDWRNRVKQEQQELDEKIKKLRSFLDGDGAEKSDIKFNQELLMHE